LPFAVVVGVVAFSFGILARSLGWGLLAPIVFSVATFSVAAQFAVAAVLVPLAPPGVPVLAASGAALLGLKGGPS
jgi:predicted branched-subunit amino acid permease